MKELIFIRHAETDMTGHYCGHSDPPVNTAGQMQIQTLLADLRTERVNAIVSSDLRRAIATAQELAQVYDIEMSVRPGLREIYFGEWEGLSWNEVENRDPVFAQRWIDAFPNLPAPGGETFGVFRSRVLDEVSAIVNNVAGDTVAVVTHAGALRVILQTLLGRTEEAAIEATHRYCCWFKYKVKVLS
jgi:broad specificity phosphatase PhoE